MQAEDVIVTSELIRQLNGSHKVDTHDHPLSIYLAKPSSSDRGSIELIKIGGGNPISVIPQDSKVDGDDIYVFGATKEQVSITLEWNGKEWNVRV